LPPCVAPAIFQICIQQIFYNEHKAAFERIRNENENSNGFAALSLRTLKVKVKMKGRAQKILFQAPTCLNKGLTIDSPSRQGLDVTSSPCPLKGTVARDFLASVFCTDLLNMGLGF
jgi:hypothetical protein